MKHLGSVCNIQYPFMPIRPVKVKSLFVLDMSLRKGEKYLTGNILMEKGLSGKW